MCGFLFSRVKNIAVFLYSIENIFTIYTINLNVKLVLFYYSNFIYQLMLRKKILRH